MTKLIILLAALAISSNALPNELDTRADDPRFTTWTAPGPGDVRSPCPGLNTLANHGFIHHDGKNMTVAHLIAGLKAGLNVGADFASFAGSGGILASPNPAGGSFNLNDLDKHNFPIEHDASLSRQDAYFGNDYSFSQSAWNMILKAYTGKTKTDIPTAAKAKYSRLQDSEARNPTLTYGPLQFVLSYGETALYIQTMGDTTSGSSRLDFIRMLFEKEKLPYSLGWRPSVNEITLTTLGNQIFQLYTQSPEPVPEGLLVTADTYKDVLAAIAAGDNTNGSLPASDF